MMNAWGAAGSMSNVVMFINVAMDPPIERVLTPRIALSTAGELESQESEIIK